LKISYKSPGTWTRNSIGTSSWNFTEFT